MNGSAATSDLIKIALAVLQSSAARSAPQAIEKFALVALMQLVAALSAIAALGCALGALWIYAAPICGAAGALLADAGILCALALAAPALARRTRELRSRSPAPGSEADALRAGAADLFRQHTGLALLAALLAGAFLGGEN